MRWSADGLRSARTSPKLQPTRRRPAWDRRADGSLHGLMGTDMDNRSPASRWLTLTCIGVVLAAVPIWHGARAQGPSIELIDPNVLRVCADPHNMPFSTERGEGFENRIADLLAKKLGKGINYTWYPGSPGFVRNTLAAYKCDVVIGMPQGADLVQVTNPYYHTTYALVSKPGSDLAGVDDLSDARLKDKHIGIVAGTPPATYMAVNGLMTNARPYPLVVDTRIDSSAAAMMADLAKGEIDAGVLWGPMAGYHAAQAKPPLSVVPLIKDKSGPRLGYFIGMGVRHTDQD